MPRPREADLFPQALWVLGVGFPTALQTLYLSLGKLILWTVQLPTYTSKIHSKDIVMNWFTLPAFAWRQDPVTTLLSQGKETWSALDSCWCPVSRLPALDLAYLTRNSPMELLFCRPRITWVDEMESLHMFSPKVSRTEKSVFLVISKFLKHSVGKYIYHG